MLIVGSFENMGIGSNRTSFALLWIYWLGGSLLAIILAQHSVELDSYGSSGWLLCHTFIGGPVRDVPLHFVLDVHLVGGDIAVGHCSSVWTRGCHIEFWELICRLIWLHFSLCHPLFITAVYFRI